MNIPEQKICQILKSIGFVVKTYRQKTIIDPANCFYSQMPFSTMKLDFALPTAHLAIEINGDYWHGSRITLLNTRQVKRRIDDAVKQMKLSQCDWKLLTVIVSDITKPTFTKKLRERIWSMLDL